MREFTGCEVVGYIKSTVASSPNLKITILRKVKNPATATQRGP